MAAYEAVADNARWAHANGVHHDRFDVSKMAQWERVFEYGDQMGMYLHFKTQETENDQRMDGGALGRERKLYYRELIARFGHHLALNWNLGEENTNTDRPAARPSPSGSTTTIPIGTTSCCTPIPAQKSRSTRRCSGRRPG